jgi:hypothetical protein
MIRPARGLACIVPLFAALCAIACDDDARDPGVVMRDSAGIRIVDNASPQWAEGEAWAVGERCRARRSGRARHACS